MINKMTPADWYQERLDFLRINLSTLLKKRKILGWTRLITVLLSFTVLWLLWPAGIFIAILAFLIIISCFLFAVTVDLRNSEKISNLELLIQINSDEVESLHYRYQQRETGEDLKPHIHEYADDLDIFGKSSLFQYLNRTRSEQGKRLLSTWVLHPSPVDTIINRQQAIKELVEDPEWYQQLQAYGTKDHITKHTEDRIHQWLNEPTYFINSRFWKLMRWLLPGLSIGSLLLHVTGILSASWFYGLLFLFFAGSLYSSKLVMPLYQQLNKITAEIETLSQSLAHVEKKTFNSILLARLSTSFKAGNQNASITVMKLKSILDRMDFRLNPLVFIPLNTFLFWDLQQAIALEKWKLKNKDGVSHWIETLAEIEALCSLANLHFNQPGWVFPVFSNEIGVFKSKDLGHPLLATEKRVTSSFHTAGSSHINLITGSNMAGKSTFLRSVGINIVLAMSGAPVCAGEMQLSPVRVMSSMRISDNLEESTSTFYAELKKLKQIIDAVNQKDRVILLLDEILRGTNSADRHTGSKALIRQLIHHDAVGLVATHDLELAKLEQEFPRNISNYHFDVQVAGDELYFDYKLKPGVCQSMNASLLMKKIGIEL